MGLQILPYKGILIPKYIISYLDTFFKIFCSEGFSR